MARIMIDPGHGGSDAGSTYHVRREKDDVLRLAKEVGRRLEKLGEEVLYTRLDDSAHTEFERAEMANRAAAGFFLSLHRNSVRTANTVDGAKAYVYRDSRIPAEVSRQLLSNLSEAGFENRGVLMRPNLTVLRRTDMPAVLLEVGFIDSEKDNKTFDTRFYEIAQGIADALVKYSGSLEGQERQLFRVQTGAFLTYDSAAAMQNRLQREGYPAFLRYQEGIYRVQVGAFEVLDNAIAMEQRLRGAGYPTFIVTG